MLDLKKELSEILDMISENTVDAWEDDLEDTRQVVVLEDFKKQIQGGDIIPDTKYNGWHERLTQLSKIV